MFRLAGYIVKPLLGEGLNSHKRVQPSQILCSCTKQRTCSSLVMMLTRFNLQLVHCCAPANKVWWYTGIALSVRLSTYLVNATCTKPFNGFQENLTQWKVIRLSSFQGRIIYEGEGLLWVLLRSQYVLTLFFLLGRLQNVVEHSLFDWGFQTMFYLKAAKSLHKEITVLHSKLLVIFFSIIPTVKALCFIPFENRIASEVCYTCSTLNNYKTYKWFYGGRR